MKIEWGTLVVTLDHGNALRNIKNLLAKCGAAETDITLPISDVRILLTYHDKLLAENLEHRCPADPEQPEVEWK